MRFEHKYFVPYRIRTALLNDLLTFTRVDTHATPTGGYRVASIYFDDPGLTAYHEKLQGQSHRLKVRCRFYPNGAEDFFNLEFKRKSADRNSKDKVILPMRQLKSLLAQQYANVIPEGGRTNDLDRLLLEIRQRHMRPFLRIDYSRIPLFVRCDHKVRVTLDNRIRTGRITLGRETTLPVIPDYFSILEIKGEDHFPLSLASIIRKYALKRRAISKYSLAAQSIAVNSALSL